MSSRQSVDRVITPTKSDVTSAKLALNLIPVSARESSDFEIVVTRGRWNEPLRAATKQAVLAILEEFAQGNAVHMIAEERELTTQEAADLVPVSRPHLIRLLNEGKIPFHWVGTHRRVMYKDIDKSRAQRWSRRKAALDELSALDQELGLNE